MTQTSVPTRPQSPGHLRESLLARPVLNPVYRVARTHQASLSSRGAHQFPDSGTLCLPTRRLDGYGRASESFEVQAHGR